MKPYYEDAGITIWHGDCREVLPILDPVDLVLTDPPYGIEYVTNRRVWRTHIARAVVGDETVPVDILSSIRIVEGGAIYWFTSERGIERFYTAAAGSGWKPKRMLVWDKGSWAAGDLHGDWAVQTEYIVWASKGNHSLRGPRPSNLLSIRREVAATRIIDHPTQKPTDLLRQLALASSDPGGTILDPFMGSGTTLRAAKDLGRKAIGIEIEERYCEIAANRMRQMAMALGV